MKLLKSILPILILINLSISAQIRMDCDGKVMIGSTSTPTKDLDVRGDVTIKPSGAYYQFIIDNTGGVYSSYPVIYPNVSDYVCLGKNDKYYYEVCSHFYWSPSDKKFKENIRDIENPLELVLNLKGVKYDMKMEAFESEDSLKSDVINEKLEEQRKNKIGFIAQDVNKVLPEVVSYDDSTDIYGIDYSKVVPVLVEAIKEQQLQIENLQDEINKLNSGDSKQKSTFENNTVNSVQLFQNKPNPFNEDTYIKYCIPDEITKASIYIYDLQGKQIKAIDLNDRGNGSIVIYGSELNAGMYIYTLIADGQVIDTKQMILTD